jgi:RNA polymerase sigma-70 factor (ECF subfamily)
MDDDELLAARFEADRARLTAVAFRVLGSRSEADDAVQEAWIRLHRSDAAGIDNLGGWLTTVVGRVCLDMLRARASRRETPVAGYDQDVLASADPADDPEREAVIADSVGLAMLVVLETLTPGERVAFVLHDVFGVPFDEIAGIVGRSPAAARQLASRARARVRGADGTDRLDGRRRREVVAAFLQASRGGDLSGLLALLDPDVVLRADATVVGFGAQPEVHGPALVAETFAGRARAARLALVDGTPGAVWTVRGEVTVVFAFTLEDDVVVAIDLLADPDILAEVEVVPLKA